MMYWHDGGWSWWAAIPMILSMALFWGLIIWAVVALTRRGGGGLPWSRGDAGAPAGGGAETAEQVLERRFARGEIDAAEYEERLRVLRGSRGTPSSGR